MKNMSSKLGNRRLTKIALKDDGVRASSVYLEGSLC